MSNQLQMHTKDKAQENFEKLSQLFPNAVTEIVKDGKIIRAIDKDVLMQEINTSVVEGKEERYQFTWPEKTNAIISANTPSYKTLCPCEEESVNFDTTKNLYIEGDNLEVLKLLQETYLSKVKIIYIDPPYNTGKDSFVYPDNFTMDNQDYKDLSATDEDGNLIYDFRGNLESNGRFHTDWLNMMYPRLKLARDLLTDDGVIFISIDDNEQENLKKICNEIFGEDNFISTFVIIRSEGGGLAKKAIIGHDYLLAYAKNIYNCKPLGKAKKIRGKIVIKDNEQYWIETDWFREVFGKYGTCHYEDILTFYNQKKKDEIDLEIKKGNYILIPKGNKHIVGRLRKISEDTSKFYTVLKYLNKVGVQDLLTLNLNKFFDYSKPISLIKDFILGGTILSKDNNDIILDFFSGSATTAHAVMQLNAEDKGNRQFIMVQLPELTDEKSEAYKAGYKNICEIGKERIRRAGKKILKENNLSEKDLDIGFRVLKLASSNMKDVYYTPAQYQRSLLEELETNIKEDRTSEDLLFQVMLDLGIDLTAKIEKEILQDKTIYFVDSNILLACFDMNLTDEIIIEIAKKNPLYAVFRDNSFKNDSVIVNVEQIFKTYSPNTVRKVL